MGDKWESGDGDEDPISSTSALIQVAVTKALRGKSPSTWGTTVIKTPSAAWVDGTARRAKKIWPQRPVSFAGGGIKPGRELQRWVDEVRENITGGRRPIIVTHDPRSYLPSFISAAIDITITIPPLDVETLIAAAKLLFGGQVRRYFADLEIADLDFDTICVCMAPLGTAKEAADRLRRAASELTDAATDDGVPALEVVAGYSEALTWSENLVADIADYRAGRLAWKEVDSAAIVHGPPGTGKSLFARITAKAAGMPVVATSIAELFASTTGHLDEMLRRQRAIFDEARQKAPCLLFIDEIDGLPARGHGGPNENYWRPIINDLLMMLDSNVSCRVGVVILGATNRIGDIDPALTRPGRLEKLLYVGPPDPGELARILRFYLRDDVPDADLRSLVAARPGATGADAVAWARAARRRARKAGRDMTAADLSAEIVGEETRGGDTLKRIAVHEAGHVIAAHALGLSVDSVTIVGSDGAAGWTQLANTDDVVLTKSQLERRVVVLLAGRAAEQALFGSDHSTAAGGSESSDLAVATKLVASWHSEFGLTDTLVYRGHSSRLMDADQDLRRAVQAELARLFRNAQDIMVKHLGTLGRLCDLLLDVKVVQAQDLEAFLLTESGLPSGPRKEMERWKSTADS